MFQDFRFVLGSTGRGYTNPVREFFDAVHQALLLLEPGRQTEYVGTRLHFLHLPMKKEKLRQYRERWEDIISSPALIPGSTSRPLRRQSTPVSGRGMATLSSTS